MANTNENYHKQWFKFYGQDWMTDIKVMRLSLEDRICYITLLCLASSSNEYGVIHDLTEEALLQLAHLYEDPYDTNNEYARAKGCLQRFSDNKMITLERYSDNSEAFHRVIINNFCKRQGSNLTGYERVKKYRDKQKTPKVSQKTKENPVINDNTNDNTNDNAREEKRREEKIREENTISKEEPLQGSEPSSSKKEVDHRNPDIEFVMDLFEEKLGIRPMPVKAKNGFDLNRGAAKWLIDKYARDDLKTMLLTVFDAQSKDRYCRTSTNPLEFKNNLAWYKTYFEKNKSKSKLIIL